MRSTRILSFVSAVALLLLSQLSFAAAVPAQAEKTGGGYNTVLIVLLSLVVVLVFVIGMLSNTLIQLTAVVKDKMRKDRKSGSGVARAILLLLSFTLPAMNLFAQKPAAEKVAPVATSIGGIAEGDFYTIITILALELIIIFSLVMFIKSLLKTIKGNPELEGAAVSKYNWFWDKFNAAAPIEKEKDVLLDHDYDGIQELDNSLPPWWKYGFYLTIIVGVIYIYRFHISHDGLSSKEEYEVAMQAAEEDKAAYLANSANNVDENSVTMLTEKADVGAGQELFTKNCVACHLQDGGGSVGPNLTDEYWIHGGGIKDVFKSIKYGWQDKGMKSWKDDFSPKQIQQLASFVKSLKGTHPAVPKAPQGDLYIEAGQPAAGGATDSTKAKTDTVAAAKK